MATGMRSQHHSNPTPEPRQGYVNPLRQHQSPTVVGEITRFEEEFGFGFGQARGESPEHAAERTLEPRRRAHLEVLSDQEEYDRQYFEEMDRLERKQAEESRARDCRDKRIAKIIDAVLESKRSACLDDELVTKACALFTDHAASTKARRAASAEKEQKKAIAAWPGVIAEHRKNAASWVDAEIAKARTLSREDKAYLEEIPAGARRENARERMIARVVKEAGLGPSLAAPPPGYWWRCLPDGRWIHSVLPPGCEAPETVPAVSTKPEEDLS